MGAPTCPEIRHTRATKKPPARTRAACRGHATGHVASARPTAYMWSIMSPQAVAALRRPRHGVALAMLHGANHGAIAGRSGNSFARLRSTMLRLATSTSRAPRVKPQTYPTSWSMTPPRAACRRMVRPTANGDAYRGRLTARAGAAPGIDFLPIRMDRASWQSESLCMHGRQPPHALIGYAPVC